MLNGVVIDVETGGLDCTKNPITQLAFQVVKLDSLEVCESYQSYVLPYNNLTLDPKALSLTGITIETLQKSPDIHSVMKQAFEIILKYKRGVRKPILIGQNVNFDIAFIKYAAHYCKLDLSKYISGTKGPHDFEPEQIDTKSLSYLKWPIDGLKHNLQSICQRAGVELVEAHSAHKDVEATTKVLFKYGRDLRTESHGEVKNDTTRFRQHFQF